MKILYGIQCTGNGHLSRARDVIPHLMKYGEVDLLMSGKQSDVSLMYSVRYRKDGLTFTFGTKGGIDVLDTLKNLRLIKLIRDVRSCPVEEYDLVLNDFEPITAWACKIKKLPCIALSHHASFLSMKTPRPSKSNAFAEMIFRHYAPVSQWYGLHFQSYDENIFTPVIRSAVRHALITEQDHVAVYLPAYDSDLLIPHLKQINQVRWEVFSKHADHIHIEGNVSICPVHDSAFIQSMATSCGVVTGGGFETPAEVLYLGKRLLSIPMTDQYEQLCNSEALNRMGVKVVKKINQQFSDMLKDWLFNTEPLRIFYPNQTEEIVDRIVLKALADRAKRA